MDTSPAIVQGGCTSPGDLGAYCRAARFQRQRLEGIERALGAPVTIERYKLADGQLVEFRFYQNARAQTARTPSPWRRILRLRKATPQTRQARLWVVGIRKDFVFELGGHALYKRVIKSPGVILVSSESGQPPGRGGVSEA